MHTCSNCHIGTLQRKAAPYAAWHGDGFVVIPNVSTWVCDVCGERTYDEALLDSLTALLGPPNPSSEADPSGAVRRGSDLPSAPASVRTRRRA
jgi:YgiT-type zinc finger domain-containing protein